MFKYSLNYSRKLIKFSIKLNKYFKYLTLKQIKELLKKVVFLV